MIFNSFGFFIFFILFFGIYLALPQRARNGFLLAGSYFLEVVGIVWTGNRGL